MELGLSLGESFTAAKKKAEAAALPEDGRGFELGLAVGVVRRDSAEEEEEDVKEEEVGERSSVEPSSPLHLSLLPISQELRPSPLSGRAAFRWPSLDSKNVDATKRSLDVNRPPSLAAEPLAVTAFSSSLFQLRLSALGARVAGDGFGGGSPTAASMAESPAARERSRGSDEDEHWAARKKLRLTKEQSAFLEDSFKEHSTLNPKQKLALAKQLDLRPRQVEVWFQNRRARTKLKQTEVDCEYLKRCCETLTEENRRLQKELAELRALKAANPFLMHIPAATLSMCPSCERVASSAPAPAPAEAPATIPPTTTSISTTVTNVAKVVDRLPNSFAALLSKPRTFPFATAQPTTAPPSSTS